MNYNLTNRAISISIEFVHLLLVFVLYTHFFQLLSIVLFSYSFSPSLTMMYIDVIIFFLFMSATSRYPFFILFISIILSICSFKKTILLCFVFIFILKEKSLRLYFLKSSTIKLRRIKISMCVNIKI